MWQAMLLKFALDFTTRVIVKAVEKGDKKVVDIAKEELVKEMKNIPNIITDEVTKTEHKRRKEERKQEARDRRNQR